MYSTLTPIPITPDEIGTTPEDEIVALLQRRMKNTIRSEAYEIRDELVTTLTVLIPKDWDRLLPTIPATDDCTKQDTVLLALKSIQEEVAELVEDTHSKTSQDLTQELAHIIRRSISIAEYTEEGCSESDESDFGEEASRRKAGAIWNALRNEGICIAENAFEIAETELRKNRDIISLENVISVTGSVVAGAFRRTAGSLPTLSEIYDEYMCTEEAMRYVYDIAKESEKKLVCTFDNVLEEKNQKEAMGIEVSISSDIRKLLRAHAEHLQARNVIERFENENDVTWQ